MQADNPDFHYRLGGAAIYLDKLEDRQVVLENGQIVGVVVSLREYLRVFRLLDHPKEENSIPEKK